MTERNGAAPLLYPGVMVSSTFSDLVEHRTALETAIDGQQMKAVMMEHDTAKADDDVLDSSLQMVKDGSAYVAVIGHSYGQIPICPRRNPRGLSLSELEFEEARRLERPILLFIMGDQHDVKLAHVERDPDRVRKLEAFRQRAKLMNDDSSVHRVYRVFENLREFEVKATQAVSGLRRFLDARSDGPSPPPKSTRIDLIPRAPAFYAEPPYIGSHRFVGRTDQLGTLDEWASSSDGNPILLFEAIGGSGKSMLTWEWTTEHATKVRGDFSGRFWYSFYEKGAVMADFCQRALAYITGEPLKGFRQLKTPELAKLLVHELRLRPWLLVLDGLERVLVSYHRFDAAQQRDEDAGATDPIVTRDPTSAIRTEDDGLLVSLAGAAPSKILLTTRLTPRALLNKSHQAIPGVRRELLPGLRPADAERMLRSCGVSGDSTEIQNYLKNHCDCHPLTTGVIAGLINNYLPARSHFDAWATAPDGGGKLNLADLDLVQKRNHILHAAIDDLSEPRRRLLATLALLPASFDYETLSALNPHIPPESVKVPPADWEALGGVSEEDKHNLLKEHQGRRLKYERERDVLLQPEAYSAAPRDLAETVFDLEARGLLQYDRHARRYDLHPVVRGVAAGALKSDDRESYGQRLIDHFSQRAHDPWENAQTLDDLSVGLILVRALVQLGRYQEAFEAYKDDLALALKENLGAFNEILSLLRPFFNRGLSALPDCLDEDAAATLAEQFAGALHAGDHEVEALALLQPVIMRDLKREDWLGVTNRLGNTAYTLLALNRVAAARRIASLSRDIAVAYDSKIDVFRRHVDALSMGALLGNWADAESAWMAVQEMGREWERHLYSPGKAEVVYADYRRKRGDLEEDLLIAVEEVARNGKSRLMIENTHQIRSAWHLDRCEWSRAADHLREVIRLKRETGEDSSPWEPDLALALLNLGHLENPRHEVERLAEIGADTLTLSKLWLAVGEPEKAISLAISAYEYAWADGEPYVRRHQLNQARALLEALGAEIPKLPPYDPARDPKFEWEGAVARAVERLKEEKATKEQSGDEPV